MNTKIVRLFMGIIIATLLAGCNVAPELGSPCRNYGNSCYQVPINTEHH